MTRVLFCVLPEKGHLNPYIGPAQALLDRGVEVVFHAPADITDQLTAAGIEHFVGERTPPPGEAHRGPHFAARIRDPAWLRQWIKSLLVDAAEDAIAPLRRAIRDVAPDVVAIDPMVYPAAIASEREQIPWAAISNSLNPVLPAELDSELLRTVDWLAPARANLFARHGMAPAFRGCDVLSPYLTVAFTTPEFAGRVPGVQLVGPSLPRRVRGDETSFPWDWLDPARALVYVSFGSQISYQPTLFRRILDAIADRPLQLVASCAELARSGELGPVPANVLLRSYVPQLALLSRSSVFVNHGGANSVMEAIACGVPMLLVPLCNDQFHQVHFIERAGIGGMLGPDPWLSIAPLLGEGPVRDRVRSISASYQRDGAGETADLLIRLAAGSHPAPGS